MTALTCLPKNSHVTGVSFWSSKEELKSAMGKVGDNAETVMKECLLRERSGHVLRFSTNPYPQLIDPISPNTMSSEPRIAETSASMWPRVRKSIAER